ncbi:MAG: hypothetical protein ACKOEX_06855, partial [Planctomycetia bacterium]
FSLVAESKAHGARVALFGRKINAAEHQLTFVRLLRAVADDQLGAADAVREYHWTLKSMGIAARRSLEDDLQRTSTLAASGG